MKKSSSVYSISIESGRPNNAHMGLFSGIAMIAGLIIGAGIFATSSGSFIKSGSVGTNLILWVFAGSLSALGGLCYVELGCAMPQSGGEHVYLKKAFGPYVAYVFDWTMAAIGFPILTSSMVLICASYVYGLYYLDPQVSPDYLATRLISNGIVLLIVLVNMISAKMGARVSDLLTVLKIGALGLIVGIGFYYLIGKNSVDNFNDAFSIHNYVPSDNGTLIEDPTAPPKGIWDFAGALYTQLFAYSGWNNLNYMVGELKKPNRNLPLAIMISMGFVISVYVLLTVSYFAVLPLDVIANTEIIATNLGQVALGQTGLILIPILVICSAFGATNASVFSNSRLIAASAEEGILFPKFLSKNTKLFTKSDKATKTLSHSSDDTIVAGTEAPMYSLILMGILTCGFCWVPELDMLIDVSSFIQCIFTFLAVAGLIRLRYSHPDMERPFRVFIPLAYIFCLVTLGLIVYPLAGAVKDQDFSSALPFLIALGLMLLPLPVIHYGLKKQQL